ncbi:InlB B-repeat-containing protein [Enterococcus sp. RIT-PI-f]|uniref:InlB B-repeat-containing protein n=1 Tax=Enterococcus sp. RIT-PI-f TaxID=1690244 RepID=UPI0006B908C0|nr:WxL domain-containing protein [Enterococcus sp. RIT-PI-f]KPG68521.1 hypothetical protein AEQ18_14760 [Enterococcus sp. RIT-PI-f]
MNHLVKKIMLHVVLITMTISVFFQPLSILRAEAGSNDDLKDTIEEPASIDPNDLFGVTSFSIPQSDIQEKESVYTVQSSAKEATVEEAIDVASDEESTIVENLEAHSDTLEIEEQKSEVERKEIESISTTEETNLEGRNATNSIIVNDHIDFRLAWNNPQVTEIVIQSGFTISNINDLNQRTTAIKIRHGGNNPGETILIRSHAPMRTTSDIVIEGRVSFYRHIPSNTLNQSMIISDGGNITLYNGAWIYAELSASNSAAVQMNGGKIFIDGTDTPSGIKNFSVLNGSVLSLQDGAELYLHKGGLLNEGTTNNVLLINSSSDSKVYIVGEEVMMTTGAKFLLYSTIPELSGSVIAKWSMVDAYLSGTNATEVQSATSRPGNFSSIYSANATRADYNALIVDMPMYSSGNFLSIEANLIEAGDPMANDYYLFEGDTTEIQANPNPGYSFSGWEIITGSGGSIANATNANTTFTMGSSDTTIRAVYSQDKYSLTLQANLPEGGNPSASAEIMAQGDTTEIQANPNPGYSFSGWEIITGSGGSIANATNANTTFTMGSSDTTIRAVYSQDKYNLTLQANLPEGGEPSANAEIMAQGETTQIHANPNPGYSFSGWEIITGSGGSITNATNANTTFTMGSSDTTIRAVYSQDKYNLTLQANLLEGGEPSANVSSLVMGGSTSISANPSAGYRFVQWEMISGAGSRIENADSPNTTFVMGSTDAIVQAKYERIQAGVVTVTFVSDKGIQLADPIKLIGDYGDTYSTKAAEITGWTVKTMPQNATGVFTEDAQFVTYIYEVSTYTITIVQFPKDAGTVTVHAPELVNTGQLIYIVAEPNEGYRFDSFELIEGNHPDFYAAPDDPELLFIFGTGDTIIHVHYERIDGANVEVNYLDTKGTKIADTKVLSGYIGDQYETEAVDIEGYLLVETPDNVNGVFKDTAQTVNYIYDTEIVAPVDPLAPEVEVEPENKPDLSENQGLFSIDFISQFNFGVQKISASDQIYYAQAQSIVTSDDSEKQERPNYIQISDRRSSDVRGVWELSVTQLEQFASERGHTLLGAQIQLTNGQIDSATDHPEPTMKTDGQVELIPGEKQSLLYAEGEQGQGTWVYRFGDAHTADQSVALNVPSAANSMATNYESKLLWELSAVPGN